MRRGPPRLKRTDSLLPDATLCRSGVTFLDTADSYGSGFGVSETLMGEALRGRRDEVVLATKFGHAQLAPATTGGGNGSRTAIRRSVEGSLRRLQTDWIDLYQVHTPDPATPNDETLDTLGDQIGRAHV